MGCDGIITLRNSGVRDFNPRSPSGLRRATRNDDFVQLYISIHAARVGCDAEVREAIATDWKISIHAARVGCDPALFHTYSPPTISIHAARVGCDDDDLLCTNIIDISIHAARVGCDRTGGRCCGSICNFNPRSPSGLRQYKNKL